MCLLQIKLRLYIFVLILKIYTNYAIINRNIYSSTNLRSSQTGSVYLNRAHPLWILEDRARHERNDRLAYSTARPYYYYGNYRRPRLDVPHTARPHMRRELQLPQRIQLPNHYIYNAAQQQQKFNFTQIPIRRQQHNLTPSQPRLLNMPTFDGMPGGEGNSKHPHADDQMVFIYNGPKGELILNTMLSARQYPMHEPVPGQILYPPSAPIFRPKPIVERFRVPESGQMLNLTLIPFYAHEAIDPRAMNTNSDFNLARVTTTAAPATVLYAKPVALVSSTSSSSPTDLAPKKPRRFKKAKQYSVYRTPDEVQWRPLNANEISMQLATPPTATTPYTVATSPAPPPSTLPNHRYADDDAVASTPLSNFRLSYKDKQDQFQIVYVDESLEKPNAQTTTPIPLPRSSRYAVSREYYAFPVFSLGKLLEPDAEKRLKYATDLAGAVSDSSVLPATTSYASYTTSSYMPADTAPSATFSSPSATSGLLENRVEAESEVPDNSDNTDTWFILNSRYKGQHKHNDQYRLSSKYIQNVANTDATRATAAAATAKTAEAQARVYQRNEFVA